jgi:hypothetical protein
VTSCRPFSRRISQVQPVLCNVTVAMSLLFHCGAAFNVRQWNSVFTRSDELRGKKSYHHFEVTESGVAFYNGTCHACNTYSHAPNVAAAGTTLLRLHASDDVTWAAEPSLPAYGAWPPVGLKGSVTSARYGSVSVYHPTLGSMTFPNPKDTYVLTHAPMKYAVASLLLGHRHTQSMHCT